MPDDPLAFIKECVIKKRMYWTWHVNMRLKGSFISRQVIMEAVENYEIIESYPEDKYLPSYLVYGRHEETIFHVLFATDVGNENVRVITAYSPDPKKWSDDSKRRKKS